MEKQEPPFCIQVELVEGCNLQCTFCGINGIRSGPGGPYKLMTMRTVRNLVEEIRYAGWNSRIEFAMHGEPSLHPDLAKIFEIFRANLPNNQLMMTSNGAGFLPDPCRLIDEVFEAGLNVLALDNYGTVKIVPKILDKLYDVAGTCKGCKKEYDLYSYPQDGLQYSPHRRWVKGTQVILIVQDIEEAVKGNHAKLTNHCGCGAPKNDTKQDKRCAKPFRELSVRWDGMVAGCCNDWRGVYPIASIFERPITELWQHRRLRAMRRKLYHGQRDFGACDGCDYTTYRNGLLPDMKGQQDISKPTRADLIALAEDHTPLTKFVRLEWEK